MPSPRVQESIKVNNKAKDEDIETTENRDLLIKWTKIDNNKHMLMRQKREEKMKVFEEYMNGKEKRKTEKKKESFSY